MLSHLPSVCTKSEIPEAIMRGLRMLLWTMLLLPLLTLVPPANAQITVIVGGPPPVCVYGYYSHPPYTCAPYGYYGPGYFYNNIFLGVGPWRHWGYANGWGNQRYRHGGYGHGHPPPPPPPRPRPEYRPPPTVYPPPRPDHGGKPPTSGIGRPPNGGGRPPNGGGPPPSGGGGRPPGGGGKPSRS